jgi:hypothetical protein
LWDMTQVWNASHFYCWNNEAKKLQRKLVEKEKIKAKIWRIEADWEERVQIPSKLRGNERRKNGPHYLSLLRSARFCVRKAVTMSMTILRDMKAWYVV